MNAVISKTRLYMNKVDKNHIRTDQNRSEQITARIDHNENRSQREQITTRIDQNQNRLDQNRSEPDQIRNRTDQ